MARHIYQPDPKRDLSFERAVDLAPTRIWAAWTEPEHLKSWFTPAPWKTVDAARTERPTTQALANAANALAKNAATSARTAR